MQWYLGHGLPVATGRALSLKLKNSIYKVYCLMSDGELDEGSNWESFLFASHHNLSNLIIVIDRNMLQSIESTEVTLSLEPLSNKLVSFGLEVEIINGHNHNEIRSSLNNKSTNKPKVIIAKTIKGKGVKFMENKVLWHYRSPNNDELNAALEEIQ